MVSTDWETALDAAIDRRFGELVDLRRHLHAHPEPSGEEFNTSLILYQILADAGWRVRMGPEGRGVLADVKTPPAAGDGQLLALRADIDALRIHDEKTVPYRSTHAGVMHACGHDAHATVLFGALSAMAEIEQAGDLPWPLRLRGIFQPAEETCRGAKEMIEIGALEGVSAILANHVDPSRKVGNVGLRDGVLTANCDDMHITIVGRGGHAARPHEARDPIAAAAQLINALYLFIPRSTDSLESVVVTIGQVIGGLNPNVIPESVQLHGTMRTLDRKVRQRTMEQIAKIAVGVEQTSDTKISVAYGVGSHSVDNDLALMKLFREAGRRALGAEHLEPITRPSMGAEDFAYYLEHVPGAMLRLGCKGEQVGGPALHAANFDIDEEAIRVGARILARAAIMWCNPNRENLNDAGFIHEGL